MSIFSSDSLTFPLIICTLCKFNITYDSLEYTQMRIIVPNHHNIQHWLIDIFHLIQDLEIKPWRMWNHFSPEKIIYLLTWKKQKHLIHRHQTYCFTWLITCSCVDISQFHSFQIRNSDSSTSNWKRLHTKFV